jgi:hypothetical protein
MSEKPPTPALSPKGVSVEPRRRPPRSRGDCFVAMPISSTVLDSYYDEAIKPTVESCGYKCIRVDREPRSDEIMRQIRDGIENSAVVIVDLTDDRPNCYFEAGYASALGKTIIFQRLHSPPKYELASHFDVLPYPIFLYGTLADLRKGLRRRLDALRNESRPPS